MMEVRCCCVPENLIGYLPSKPFFRAGAMAAFKKVFYPGHWMGAYFDRAGIEDEAMDTSDDGVSLYFRIRELSDETLAYSAEGHDHDAIRALPGFEPPRELDLIGKKTWRKTWRGK